MRYTLLLVVSLLALSACQPAPQVIFVENSYVVAVPVGNIPTSVYMTIENRGSAPQVLVSATSDAATYVELHEAVIENDVMQMRPVANGVEIPANSSVTLGEDDYHIMLTSVLRNLEPGQDIGITLRFQSGIEFTVYVPVRDLNMEATATVVALTPTATPDVNATEESSG